MLPHPPLILQNLSLVAKRPARVLLGLLLFSLCLLTGCQQNERQQRVKTHVAKIKARPAQPIAPLSKIKPFTPVVYQAHDLRSPFHRPKQVQVTAEQPNLKRPKETLEVFPLDALKMVGTISQNKVRWALIKAPDGTIYSVKKGNYLGKRFGRIVKITSKEIDLIESVQVGSEWQKRKVVLAISEESAK